MADDNRHHVVVFRRPSDEVPEAVGARLRELTTVTCEHVDRDGAA